MGNHVAVALFAKNGDIDSAGDEDILENGGSIVWAAAAAASTIESADADDTAAGAGARTVEVVGLDTNYVELTETVALNGTTPVALVNTYLRINNVTCKTFGATGHNEGLITVKIGSDSVAFVAATKNMMESTQYSVPVGKELRISEFSCSCPLIPALAVLNVELKYRPFGDDAWHNISEARLEIDLDHNFTKNWMTDAEFVVPPKADIRIAGGTTVDSTGIHASFSGKLLEANTPQTRTDN